MGFETYLLINDEVALMWRKHASPLPRVLFEFDDLRVGPRVEGTEVGEASPLEVRFCTTIAAARSNLERAGLGWGAAVAAYADIRVDGYSSGFFIARHSAHGNGARDVRDLDRQLAAFESLPAEDDLQNLSRLMTAEWMDPECPDVSVLTELSYDGDLAHGPSQLLGILERSIDRAVDSPYAAARAAESLATLDRIAPMLAWPLILCVFLQHLPDEATVELQLTEDAAETDATESVESAREYAVSYWTGASELMATQARVLERLFAVLAGSAAAAGPEFWFARSADLFTRLRPLAATGDVTARARGDALESLVDALFRTEEPELQVIEKNLRTRQEELDLLLTNGLRDPFWSSLTSPLILVECKNWSKKVGVAELRILESKMRDRGALCRIGLFVSLSGFTSSFLSRLRSVQTEGGVIFAMDGNDLGELVASKRRITDWMREEGLRRALRGRG